MKVHEVGDFFHQNAVRPPTIKSIAGNTAWSGGERTVAPGRAIPAKSRAYLGGLAPDNREKQVGGLRITHAEMRMVSCSRKRNSASGISHWSVSTLQCKLRPLRYQRPRWLHATQRVGQVSRRAALRSVVEENISSTVSVKPSKSALVGQTWVWIRRSWRAVGAGRFRFRSGVLALGRGRIRRCSSAWPVFDRQFRGRFPPTGAGDDFPGDSQRARYDGHDPRAWKGCSTFWSWPG